jgi:outer membrane protein assembly factor BamB
MENKHRKILSAIIAMLLLSSTLVLLTDFAGTKPVSAATTDTSNLLQYEWQQLGATGGWTLYSAGPGPNRPQVAWTRSGFSGASGFAGTLTAFNGLVFFANTNAVTAFDAFTGQTRWTYTSNGANFQTAPTKIDDTYLFLDGGSGAGGLGYTTPAGTITNETLTVLRTSDGTFVSNYTVVGVGFQPGTGGYFPGRYAPETHMKYIRGYNAQTNELSYYAIDLTDPTRPTQAWKTVFDESGEDLSVGGGVLLVGTVNGAIIALNWTTGAPVWRTLKIGFAQYTATYIASDNTFIQGSSSTSLTCYNATNGDILWDKPQGGRAFFAFAGATAYGRFYQHNIAVPAGYVACWDVVTGDLLWKMPALYQIGYITPVVADGKVYIQRTSGTAAGVASEQTEFVCYDAYTGAELWAIPQSIVNPSIAYGNLYVMIGSSVYCFSDATPQDWINFRGDVGQTGITQSTAPSGAGAFGFNPTLTYKTDGPITSSPALVAGKVYFGSQDKNIYCLDANTGQKIWNFTTQYRVFSSPAVSGGRVFTGADDGSIYALDANTGQQIWKTTAGGITNYVFAGTWQPRSSPIIVGSRLYVGALDGKLYCLDTSNGGLIWALPLGSVTRPIAGSPSYSNGYVYICATNHNLYKIDATTGAIMWTTSSNATIARAYTDFYTWSTPVVYNNTVYWGAGPVYGLLVWYALNATTGKQIWNLTSSSAQTPQPNTFTGNTPTCQTPVLLQWNNSLSVMIVSEFMGVSIFNANNGSRIWKQFLGHEVYSSVCYANDTQTPKFYIGSDTYAITCFNMTAAVRNDTAHAVLGVYTTYSHVQSSPAVWDGKLYVTSADNNLYVFKDIAVTQMSLFASASKYGEMWNNETLQIAGKLAPAPGTDYGSFVPNGLPNATVNISLTKPNGNSENLTTTTDKLGEFSLSFSPTEVGQWGWVAYYSGDSKPSINYTAAYSEFTNINVSEAPVAPTSTPVATPTPTSEVTPTPTPEVTATPTPTEAPVDNTTTYIYAIVGVIVIIAIVIGAYAYTKRGKKKPETKQ